MSSSKKKFSLYVLMNVLVFVYVIVYLFRGIFVNPEIAAKALEKQGYENVQVLEKHWFLVGLQGCDGSDAVKFVVRASNPAKSEVEVCVCAGWPFKKATIRTD